MSKIKVGELRETIKELKSKQNDVQTVDFHGLKIEIKQYIPFLEKIAFASSIYESAVNKKEGLHIVNENSLDVAFKIFLIQTYTNISLPQKKDEDGEMNTDTIQSYEMLVSSGLFHFVYDNIPVSEISDLEMVLGNLIDTKQVEYDQRNVISDRELRIENVIKDGIDSLLAELTRFIDRLPEKDEWEDIMKDIPQSLDGLFNQIKEGSKALGKDEQDYLGQLVNTVVGDMANRAGKMQRWVKMANVKNYKDLEVALTKALAKAMPKVGDKTVELVKDRIDKDVYGAGSPTVYERTYELRESVEVGKISVGKSTVETEIGHNPTEIGSYSPNQHYSVVDGSHSSDSIAEIVHDGKSSHILGTGFWTKPRPYMDNAKKEMKDGKYKEFMIEQLRKQGFDAK